MEPEAGDSGSHRNMEPEAGDSGFHRNMGPEAGNSGSHRNMGPEADGSVPRGSLVLIPPCAGRNTVYRLKCTGKMKLIFISYRRTDICDG